MVAELTYQVALSFAEEDRDYVERVAHVLKDHEIRVFYDLDEEVKMWEKDMGDELDSIYRKQSEYVVMFISAHYASKAWTNHERKSALARAILERREFVLPARFDDTELPGLRDTIRYIDLSTKSPEKFANLIMEKLGLPVSSVLTEKLTPVSEESTKQFELQLSSFVNEISTQSAELLSSPHWLLVVRPTAFKSDRVRTLPECKRIVDTCKINARNYEFPYVTNSQAEVGNDWVGGKSKNPVHPDHWRFYQSGQLIQVSPFRENSFSRDCEQKASQILNYSGFKAQGYHDVIITIDVVLDVFQFAAKIASYGAIPQGCEIGIFMIDVKDHILISLTHGVRIYDFFATSAAQLGRYRQYSSNEILEKTNELAKDAANDIFHRFGWFKAPMDDLFGLLSHR